MLKFFTSYPCKTTPQPQKFLSNRTGSFIWQWIVLIKLILLFIILLYPTNMQCSIIRVCTRCQGIQGKTRPLPPQANPLPCQVSPVKSPAIKIAAKQSENFTSVLQNKDKISFLRKMLIS